MTDPTRDQFGAYALAFDYFNEALFNGELPRCILNFSRGAQFNGFFAPLRWARTDGRTHEISLNPDVLHRPAKATMATLVHEMVHLWQQEHGKPSRTGYHNREWADRMEMVGLMPSDSGLPEGKRTGQRVTHYVIDGGPFDVAFQAMPPDCLLPWMSGAAADEKKKPATRPSKVKYTCPGCASNVWGRLGLLITCGACQELFVCEVETEPEPSS